MASYMNAVDVFRALIPRAERIDRYPALPAEQLHRSAGVRQAAQAEHRCRPGRPSDAEFLRRVYLDVIGTLADRRRSTRVSLADTAPTDAARLVDELARPAGVRRLLGAEMGRPAARGSAGAWGTRRAYAYYRWIRDSLAANKPLDQFARELLTAEGPLDETPAANFYKVVDQARRDGQHAVAGVPGRAHRLCRVPSSSVRPLEPDRLLRHAGLFHPGRRDEIARAANHLWPRAQADPSIRGPARRSSPTRWRRQVDAPTSLRPRRPPAGCWPTG